MNRGNRAFACFAALLLAGIAVETEAVPIDPKGTFTVTAKAYTRLSIRLSDAEGFTNPDVSVGDIVQHRNLLLLEVNHDLQDLTRQMDLLCPLRALGVRAKYRILGRFLYEGIYDYGPEIFQEVRESDKDNIDSFKQSYDLWEAYADLSRGPLLLRVGKQILAWGETDIFRLLDYINPLDNTFGGPFEDLDDRRIPLWMVMGNYNLGTIGPVSSLTLEGFWVPGFWEAHVSPWAPDGTPYEVPLGYTIWRVLKIHTPDKDMSDSRWGVRVQGVVGENFNVSAAHYSTFLDLPALRAVVTTDDPILLDVNDLYLEGFFPRVQITGGSLSFWDSHTDTICRVETACFWDEPVLIPEENLRVLYDPVLPLPDDLMRAVGDLYDLDLLGLGLRGLPLQPKTGSVPRKDVLRYMIGLDKQMWIRPLNPVNTFFVSFQYFGQWIPDYDPRLRQPLERYPDLVNFTKVKETEHVVTALVMSSYCKGTVNPQVAVAYDLRGAVLIQPSVQFIYGPLRLLLQYSAIEGAFTNFGVFRDRDQISFTFSYLLN